MSRRILWIAGGLLFLGCGLPQLPAMHTMCSLGTDLLTFEFVSTTSRANNILSEWGDEGRDAAYVQLAWDLGFIPGYGLLLWLSATATGVGRLFVLLGPAAASMDLLENLSLFMLLQGETVQPWPALATIFASLKFAGIGVCLIAIIWKKFPRRS